MPDNDKLDILLEKFYNRFNKYNTKVLKKMGETIKQFDKLTPSQAHILAQELKYGNDIDELLEELTKLSEKSMNEVQIVLDKVAEENVDFAETCYKAKNKEFIKYKDNIQLKRYVESVAKETDELFKNLSNARNIGFTYKNAKGKTIFKPIKRIYNELIDEAVYNVSIGVQDYQSAMRNAIKSLADSGVKIHEDKIAYTGGYSRRIDSSVKMNILTGVRQVNIGVQEIVGQEIGADGVEISAHYPCAEDHLFINGRQFSNKEFERINAYLDRPVGEYNCRHFVFSIVLGVTQPNYTDKQLKHMEKESIKIVEYDGNKYTKYEATQVQRKLETEIRKQKDRQIIAKASNDMEEVQKAQEKITQLINKYNDFSKSVELDTYKENLTVSGYKRMKVRG